MISQIISFHKFLAIILILFDYRIGGICYFKLLYNQIIKFNSILSVYKCVFLCDKINLF